MRQEKTHIDDPKKHNRHARRCVGEVRRFRSKKEKENENSQHHDRENHGSLTEIGGEREKKTETYPDGFLPPSTFWKGEPVEFDEALACDKKNEK